MNIARDIFANMKQRVAYIPDREYHYRLQPGDGTAYTFSIVELNPALQGIYHRDPDSNFILNITMPSVGGSVIASPNDGWGNDFEHQVENLYVTIKPHLQGVHDFTIYMMATVFMVLTKYPLNILEACEKMAYMRNWRREQLLKEEE